MLSKSRAINVLSGARMFLFGARDVWFVVALPVYLSTVFHWDFWKVGGFLAAWVIGYGIIQSVAPAITGKKQGRAPDGRAAFLWALLLAVIPAIIAICLQAQFNPYLTLFNNKNLNIESFLSSYNLLFLFLFFFFFLSLSYIPFSFKYAFTAPLAPMALP